MSAEWHDFEHTSGVPVADIPLNLVRLGDVLDFETGETAFRLLVTEAGHGRGVMAVGYIGDLSDPSNQGKPRFEPLLYQVEVRGGCRMLEQDDADGLAYANSKRLPLGGIAAKLALSRSVCLVDRSGEGAVIITPPLKSLRWLVKQTSQAS